MDFSVNVWAVLLATVVYFALGALWYMALSRPWMAAVGFTRADVDDLVPGGEAGRGESLSPPARGTARCRGRTGSVGCGRGP